MSNAKQSSLRMSVTRLQLAPYLRACQEGWAPQPTNEYQKAIWEKVHTIPSNQMKIKYQLKK